MAVYLLQNDLYSIENTLQKNLPLTSFYEKLNIILNYSYNKMTVV